MDKEAEYCTCPFSKYCHKPRQFAFNLTKNDLGKTIRDCWFYKEFEKEGFDKN